MYLEPSRTERQGINLSNSTDSNIIIHSVFRGRPIEVIEDNSLMCEPLMKCLLVYAHVELFYY